MPHIFEAQCAIHKDNKGEFMLWILTGVGVVLGIASWFCIRKSGRDKYQKRGWYIVGMVLFYNMLAIIVALALHLPILAHS